MTGLVIDLIKIKFSQKLHTLLDKVFLLIYLFSNVLILLAHSEHNNLLL